MTISVTGLGSGLDYDSWITALVAVKQAKIDEVSTSVTSITTQETALSSLKTNYTSLSTAVKAFTDALSDTSVFNQKTATSSNTAVTAAVDSTAGLQNVKVTVEQLATSTTAKSATTAGSYVDSDTDLNDISEGALTAGTFSLYVNGSKQTIELKEGSTDGSLTLYVNGTQQTSATEGKVTLGEVATAINSLSGVASSVSSDGKLTISGESSTDTLTIGSSSDTSNFTDVMSLAQSNITNEDETVTTSFTSSKSLFDTDTSATLASTATGADNAKFAVASVTQGTFTIGSAEFTIDEDTTLDSIISEINNSDDAGATAYWDSNAGKLVLEAKDGGAININVESDVANGGSNFTYVMGLTSSDGQTLTDSSQTLGTNAKLTINGTSITSSSNTVTSDISGITGLTLTLNDETTSTATVAITADTTAATTAINTFVSAFNTVISNTDTATSNTGYLYGETILNSIRNKLRTMISADTGNDTYSSLADIGITTGAIGTSVSEDTNQLVVDSTKLAEALAADPDAVSKLLLGGTNTDGTATTGVMSQMETVLDNSLNETNGYFVKREDSFEKSADRLNDKIDRMTLSLASYKAQLEAKFSAMDTIISNLKSQGSVLDNYLAQISDSDDD